MENASKALLIAAAVLIVILLIAFGMSIFNSTGDTSSDAQAVGESIVSSTSSAKIKAIFSMIDIYNDDEFNNYIKNNYGGEQSVDKIKEMCTLVTERTKKIFNNNKKIYAYEKLHIASTSDKTQTLVRCNGSTIVYYLEEGKTYTVYFEGTGGRSIRVR